MPKRKVISESDKAPQKKLKSDSNVAPKAFVSKLSFDSSEQCLRSLIYPTTLEDFLSKYWEKEPLFVHRNNTEYFKEFPTKAKLEEIAKKEELKWNKDLFVSQSENGAANPEVEGRATIKKIQKFLKEKLVIMFDKPHRFHDELYQLLLLLEEYFGCCVRCHLEVNTVGGYGKKPTYIGREEIILQIEGKKRWCLFKPIQKLAFLDSEDLSPDDIGGVTHEFVLQPGDLLYFPRGTVCRVHSVAEEGSSHISLELFEGHNWGHFLSNILEKAVNEALENDVTFREGLPIKFLGYMGYGKKEFKNDVNGTQEEQSGEAPQTVVPTVRNIDLESQKLFKEKMLLLLSTLGQYLDPHWGADIFFGKDFMAERLPPTRVSEEEKPSETEQPPTDESLIEMKHREHVRIVFRDPGDEWGDDDESEDDDDGSEDDENMGEEPEDKEEASEKKDKKSQKVGKNKGEKKSQKSKTDAEEKDAADDEMPCDEELDESFGSKPCIVLQHSLNNVVESDDEEDLDEDDEDPAKESKKVKFPLHYRDALLILHRTPGPVAVCNLPLKSEERVELAVTLWCEGLVTEVKKS